MRKIRATSTTRALDFAARQPLRSQRARDVVEDAAVGIERVALEGERYGPVMGWHVGDVLAAQDDPPGIRQFEPGDDT